MAPGSQAASAEGREELGKRLAEAGLPMFGVLTRDPLLASVRLDEIQAALQARAVAGGAQHPDAHFDKVSHLLAVVEMIAMLYTAPTNFLLARVDMKVNLEAPSPAEIAKAHLRSTKRLRKFCVTTCWLVVPRLVTLIYQVPQLQLTAPTIAVVLRQVVVASGNTEDLLADVAGAEPARVLAIAGHGAAEGAVLALAAAKSGNAGPHAAGMLLTDVKAGKPALGPHACKVLRVAPGLIIRMYAIFSSYMINMECPLFVHHAQSYPDFICRQRLHQLTVLC